MLYFSGLKYKDNGYTPEAFSDRERILEYLKERSESGSRNVAASIWEAAIKSSLGKLEADIDSLVSEIARSGFVELPISASHAAMMRKLPDVHRDPFDRMLVAQAMTEPLRLVTSDASLAMYTDLVLLV